MNSCRHKESNKAFTIIELLIVIVIIGILVAITAVSYNGVTKGAKEASLQSDLKQAKTSLELNKAKTGTYPPNLESNIPPIDQPKNSTFTYTQLDGGTNYKLVVNDSNDPAIAYQTFPNGTIFKACPANWIAVPGDPYYGTTDFCVMKYEVKNVGGVATSQAAGTPWVSINQADAKAAALASGTGHHLITDPEWMTIAMNVINNPVNWQSGVVGQGSMYNGHVNHAPSSPLGAGSSDNDNLFGMTTTGNPPSANNQRTLTLSNGEVIWDLAGNAAEWTDATIAGGQPGLSEQTGYTDNNYSNQALRQNNLPDISWPTGVLYGKVGGVGTIKSNPIDLGRAVYIRGGNWGNLSDAGVLRLNLDHTPSSSGNAGSFRVAR